MTTETHEQLSFAEALPSLAPGYITFSTRPIGYGSESVSYLGKVSSIHNDPNDSSRVIVEFEWVAEAGMNQIYLRIGDRGHGSGIKKACARANKPKELCKKDGAHRARDMELDFFLPDHTFR